MNTRSTVRLFALLACGLLLVPDLDAQRGGGRRGGGGGGRAGKAKKMGQQVLRSLIPKPLPPVEFPKLSVLPKTTSELPDRLLPSAGEPPVAGLVPGTDIPKPDEGNYVIWTDPLDPELEEYYFSLCDHDENTWISYREGIFSLSLNRQQFSYYDNDRDGRIQRTEFGDRYKLIVGRRGGFPPPKPHLIDFPDAEDSSAFDSGEQPDTDSDGYQLLVRFDTNESAALELGEIPPLIDLFLVSKHVEAAQLLKAIDLDLSSAIELAEISLLIEGLSTAQLRFLGNFIPVQSLLEDSNPSVPILTERAAPLVIERSLLPKAHFERLDQNGDGFIGTQDLRTLQAPMHLSVRTNAVIASMDSDGDGKISDAEFLAAFE